MARRKTRTLTEGELEFMQVLWTKGEATPEDMQTALAEIGRLVTGGTVRNVLATLMKKRYVTRKKRGKAFVYKAHIEKDQAARSFVRDLLTRVFNGSESLMVASLLSNHELSEAEIQKIRSLIADKTKGETR